MAENNPNPNPDMANDQKIDAIKQLIFGDNIADYNQRFEELNLVIEDVRSELDNRISDLESQVTNTIAILRQDYEKDVTKLENKLDKEVSMLNNNKVDRKSLGKMFENIAEKLQS